ncbi:MAG: glycoside hydrolase family 9 protein [Verrucomicrobia bacterium]|nr:glycoside hydrolase family 9 protein [Verrucomicrobiota bacterium]
MNMPNVLVSQVGFPCGARKRCVVPGCEAAEFEIQDVSQHLRDAIGEFENWRAIFRGRLERRGGPMGAFSVGDFSKVQAPGIYRVVLPGDAGHSYPFVISDAAHSHLPRLFLDYVHSQRCGPFENEWRGPCHLDDGLRSDNGQPVDAVGGWHDAGDLRKWMTTTPLPALAFMHTRARLASLGNHWREDPFQDDLLNELIWGLRFVLKMQDPSTGMIYEDVGGGGDSRRTTEMTWWHENHAGVYADNEENHFTDNAPNSGDERTVRVQYNPIVQYTNIAILAGAAEMFCKLDAKFARQCSDAGLRCWRFMSSRVQDEFHQWTSVLAWRLLAALRLVATGAVGKEEVAEAARRVLDLQDATLGFWHLDLQRRQPYRGILQSAQPLLAAASLLELGPSHPLAPKASDALRRCWDAFIEPMRNTNPFGIIPYAMYRDPPTTGDVYHPLDNGRWFRFFMHTQTPQKINHGISAHWTSWAHALALAGTALGEGRWREAAWDQLHWLMGNNPLNTSLISGVGYRIAMPYSRFLGAIPGGFCLGPRGDAADGIFIDPDGRCDCVSCEYWMTPLANALMALSLLLPKSVDGSRKLGYAKTRQIPTKKGTSNHE